MNNQERDMIIYHILNVFRVDEFVEAGLPSSAMFDNNFLKEKAATYGEDTLRQLLYSLEKTGHIWKRGETNAARFITDSRGVEFMQKLESKMATRVA